MKTFLFTVIGTIIAGVTIYYITVGKPDLVYSLSQAVSICNQEGNFKAQEIEIINEGDSVAEKIRVFFDKPVPFCKVIKHSEGDKIDVYQLDQTFEVVYDELPPKGRFKINFITNFGVEEYDSRVSHKNGTAKELNSGIIGRFGYAPLFFAFSGIVYFLLMCWSLFSDKKRDLESSSESEYRYNYIMKKKKPFYIDKVSWDDIRLKAIDSMIKSERFYGKFVEDFKNYELLNENKPENYSENEWNHLTKKAIESLTKAMEYEVASLYTYGNTKEALKLLKVKKPKNFPNEKWDNLRTKIFEIYLTLKRAELYSDYYNLSESALKEMKSEQPEDIDENKWKEFIELCERLYFVDKKSKLYDTLDIKRKALEEIASKKPEVIKRSSWEKYIEMCKDSYFSELSKRIESQNEPIEYLKEQPLEMISERQKNDLMNRAYRKNLSSLMDMHNPIYAKEFIESKRPEWIENSDYERLSIIAKKTLELDKITKENHEKEKELKKEKEKFEPLKRRVMKQLEIIHIFLTDPSILDRIEDYSEIFAPRNFENLRKASELIKITALKE